MKRILATFILFTLIFPLSIEAGSSAFDSTGCEGYFEITSDNTKVDNANDNLIYDLSNAPSDYWSEDPATSTTRIVNNAGDTAYSAEYENFSDNGTTGTGIVYFDSSNLQTGSDTTWRIYQCSGKSGISPGDTLGSQNVWNANYKAVYHLNESSGTRSDSTANSNDLTDNNTVGSGTGQVAGAADFEADNSEYLSAGDTASLSAMSPYTIVSWINIESAPGTYGIVNKNNGGDNDAEFQYFYRDQSGLRLQADFWDSSQNETQGDATVDLGTGTWKHVVLVMDVPNATGQFYVDGSAITTSDTITEATSVIDSNNALQLGGQDTSFNFDGLMDEVRILETTLSANWISTEQNNQSSPGTFWTTGTWTAAAVAEKKQGFGITEFFF